MLILAVESSCDETAVALVRDGREVLTDQIFSQAALHAVYGGVVPEIASRSHVEVISQLADRALAEAGVTRQDIDAVDVLRQVFGSSCEGCKSRHDVGEIDCVLKTLHGHLARLIDNERHTYSTLVELPLASLEAGITVQLLYGCLNCGAVVRGKDDERVLTQPHALQLIEQTTYGSVHVSDK